MTKDAFNISIVPDNQLSKSQQLLLFYLFENLTDDQGQKPITVYMDGYLASTHISNEILRYIPV